MEWRTEEQNGREIDANNMAEETWEREALKVTDVANGERMQVKGGVEGTREI